MLQLIREFQKLIATYSNNKWLALGDWGHLDVRKERITCLFVRIVKKSWSPNGKMTYMFGNVLLAKAGWFINTNWKKWPKIILGEWLRLIPLPDSSVHPALIRLALHHWRLAGSHWQRKGVHCASCFGYPLQNTQNYNQLRTRVLRWLPRRHPPYSLF